MFKELTPILTKRALVLIVAGLADGRIRLNISAFMDLAYAYILGFVSCAVIVAFTCNRPPVEHDLIHERRKTERRKPQ